jgi:hypothetical protein
MGNPYIEEQTTQWPNEKVQQKITIYKTKDRATRIQQKAGR